MILGHLTAMKAATQSIAESQAHVGVAASVSDGVWHRAVSNNFVHLFGKGGGKLMEKNMAPLRADPDSARADATDRLVALKNVGPKSAVWMIEVGVDTPERLIELGAVEVYRRMKAAYPREVSLCAVWALQGAIDGVASSHLPSDVKQALKNAVSASGQIPDEPS